MRVGLVVPQHEIGTDPSAVVEWARAVETAGFHHIDVFDHVLGADVAERPDWRGPYTHEHRFHEPFVLLSFLAGQVGLELATGVLVLPQRQTALVAKQAAALDVLSGGRLRLGVGIGWNQVEHEALGGSFHDRADRYEEQIELLRRLWTEPVVDFAGAHHRVDRAGIAPLPVQRPIPTWLGGGHAPRVLDRIGRLADGWVVHDPHPGPELTASLAVVAASAERAGRDPGSIGVQGRIDIHGTVDRDRLRRAVDRWVSAGATHLSLHLTGQHGSPAHIDHVHQLAETVFADLDTAHQGAPP